MVNLQTLQIVNKNCPRFKDYVEKRMRKIHKNHMGFIYEHLSLVGQKLRRHLFFNNPGICDKKFMTSSA